MSTLDRLRARWATSPLADRPALQTDRETLDGATLWARVDRARGWLRGAGLGRGDVLALQVPRAAAFLETHLAALAEGVVTLPIDPRYTPSEVSWILDDARPALAVLVHPEGTSHPALAASALRAALDGAPTADGAVSVSDDDVALLCYTSGTTGRPKGALISHGNLEATVRALHDAWAFSPGDTLLHALPLFHIHGLIAAQHVALWARARTVWMDRFDADAALARLGSGEVTVFMGVPTFYERMLRSTATPDLSSVRLFTSGSAPLPARTWEAFRDRFGHEILERYGMTEVGIVLSNPLSGPRKPGAVGRPLPGVAVRIVDPETGGDVAPGEVGELQVAGPSVFRGYLGRPDATAQALTGGWMRTGDLGLVDADGDVHLRGRRTELILCGGFNVYPPEVEAALREHPAIGEAAVLGLPDPDLGERVAALIVPRGVAPDPLELDHFLRQRLAPYKVPVAVRLVPELPRNAMGKVETSRARASWASLLPPTAPHADALRALRPAADRAARAAIDLARVAPLPGDADRSCADDAIRRMAADVLDRWLPDRPHADLQALRHHLGDLAAQATALGGRVEALRREQHEALHAAEHEALVAFIEALARSRATLQARLQDLTRRELRLTTLTQAARDAAARVAAAPAPLRPAIARATRAALTSTLAQASLEVPAEPGDDEAWLSSLPAAFTAELERISPEARWLDARSAELGQLLDRILG